MFVLCVNICKDRLNIVDNVSNSCILKQYFWAFGWGIQNPTLKSMLDTKFHVKTVLKSNTESSHTEHIYCLNLIICSLSKVNSSPLIITITT